MSKKWLIDSASHSGYGALSIQDLNEWDNYKNRLPKYLIKTFKDISKEIPSCKDDLEKLMKLTKDICKLESVSLHERKLRSDIGLSYLKFSGSFVSLYASYFDALYLAFLKDMSSTDTNINVPHAVLSEFKRYEFLTYLLGCAGINFIAGASNYHKNRRWCKVCFRRAAPGFNFCQFHDTRNESKSSFRLGIEILTAIKKDESTILVDWKNHRRSIVEKEGWELEFDDTFSSPSVDWKTYLIRRVRNSPTLTKKLDILKVESFASWREAVDYLRMKLENPQEKCLHIEAVWSWLAMAEKWFEYEDCFKSDDGTKLRASRSSISNLPTEKLIATLCENEPEISKSEIARQLKISPAAVGQYIKRHVVLHKYFNM
jgi:hypothetical protein